MNDKKNTYMYSKTASEQFGANLITLKNGKQFFTTSIFDSSTYNDQSYAWKDKQKIYECTDSDVLKNEQTERAKIKDKSINEFHPIRKDSRDETKKSIDKISKVLGIKEDSTVKSYIKTDKKDKTTRSVDEVLVARDFLNKHIPKYVDYLSKGYIAPGSTEEEIALNDLFVKENNKKKYRKII